MIMPVNYFLDLEIGGYLTNFSAVQRAHRGKFASFLWRWEVICYLVSQKAQNRGRKSTAKSYEIQNLAPCSLFEDKRGCTWFCRVGRSNTVTQTGEPRRSWHPMKVIRESPQLRPGEASCPLRGDAAPRPQRPLAVEQRHCELVRAPAKRSGLTTVFCLMFSPTQQNDYNLSLACETISILEA